MKRIGWPLTWPARRLVIWAIGAGRPHPHSHSFTRASFTAGVAGDSCLLLGAALQSLLQFLLEGLEFLRRHRLALESQIQLGQLLGRWLCQPSASSSFVR